jgi:hypothetical protein
VQAKLSLVVAARGGGQLQWRATADGSGGGKVGSKLKPTALAAAAVEDGGGGSGCSSSRLW